jgi:hypothetical protein
MGEEGTMKTRRITRPTLADLWRHLLATLECLGVEDAPDMARSLAVSGLVGRQAEAKGVRVERSGEVVTISSTGPSMNGRTPANRHGVRERAARRRSKVPAGC